MNRTTTLLQHCKKALQYVEQIDKLINKAGKMGLIIEIKEIKNNLVEVYFKVS
jgi:hypothetical protein